MSALLSYSIQATAAIAAVITFLIIFTIFGNILVIIAVLTSRSLKAPQNLFLVSLAAADILVATLIIPFSLANELMGYWYFGKTWCEMYLALDVLFCTSSIVHLCAISLDRYWSVSQAIEYTSKRTPRRIKGIILIVWTISAFISFPPLIYKGKKDSLNGKPQCKLNEEPWYILSSSICSFFAPCLIMILVYLRIYLIAKRRSRKSTNGSNPQEKASGLFRHCIRPTVRTSIRSHTHTQSLSVPMEKVGSVQHGITVSSPAAQEHNDQQTENANPLQHGDNSKQTNDHGPPMMDTLATSRGVVLLASSGKNSAPNLAKKRSHINREKRFTFVLAVVIGVFVLCWFPFFFTYSLGAICPKLCHIPDSVFQFFFWIGYCNSSLNPVIYTIFNQDFRKAFRRILCSPWAQTVW